ncbi:unnamed protein product [Adineta ricciae]|nr:unnamed protein product [Adineta ricciae]
MTTTTATSEPGIIPMKAAKGKVYGVYDTYIGGNSTEAEPGRNRGNYMPGESPDKACDGRVSTKYLSFGPCGEAHPKSTTCGVNTGFYLELEQGSTLVNGLKICTGDDVSGRDPILVSLEGSNMKETDLTFGSSWTLLYNGTSGLYRNPGRKQCGDILRFNNTEEYTSYRFLVSDKRKPTFCCQYSEVKLYNL